MFRDVAVFLLLIPSLCSIRSLVTCVARLFSLLHFRKSDKKHSSLMPCPLFSPSSSSSFLHSPGALITHHLPFIHFHLSFALMVHVFFLSLHLEPLCPTDLSLSLHFITFIPLSDDVRFRRCESTTELCTFSGEAARGGCSRRLLILQDDDVALVSDGRLTIHRAKQFTGRTFNQRNSNSQDENSTSFTEEVMTHASQIKLLMYSS